MKQSEIHTIRTLECDICNRFDTIMISTEEIEARVRNTDLGIGAYSINHKDHIRIVYFDINGEYLGDTIALSQEEIPNEVQTHPLPKFIINAKKNGLLSRLRKKIFNQFNKKSYTLTVVGPSRAGKTSLVRYLETLIPERDSTIIPSVPTMGKSKKKFKLGKTSITSLDMGGQEDFWDLWENSIKEADAIFFLIDATSNNLIEIAHAFEKIISYRVNNTPVLVILNKKDLLLRGEASRFISSGEFLSLTKLKQPIDNVVSIETSVFEGIAYETTEFLEIPLAEVITSFIDDYC